MTVDIHLDSIQMAIDTAMVIVHQQMKELKLDDRQIDIDLKDLDKQLQQLNIELKQLDKEMLGTGMDMEKLDAEIKKIQALTINSIGEINDSNVVIYITEGNGHELNRLPGNNVQQKIIMINNGDTAQMQTEQRMEIKVVIKTCNIEDLDKEDQKLLRSEGKANNHNLKIENVDFYPNPNNGRFQLSFTLKDQGDTEISVFSMEGKRVYQELLPGFTGNYRNQIDISENANGIYYIKVTQGKNSWFKKMILQ